MNKEQEVNAIYKDLNQKYTRQTVKDIYESMIRVELQALENGHPVKKIGYGTLEPVKRKARIGVIPRTKNRINIPSSMTVVFRAGKPLKKRLNTKN